MTRISRLALIAALIGLPAAAQAQTITGSISASATIATVFAFGTPVSLNFGVITPGASATGSGSVPLQRNVGVLYSLPDGALTGQLVKGTVTLTPTYTCGVGATAAAIANAFSSCTAAAGTTVLTMPAPAGTLTEYVIFNGTLASTQTNVAPGLYSGSIRINATAN